MLVLMNEIFILKSTVMFFSLIFNFMPLQNKCCPWRSTSRLPLLAELKSKKKKLFTRLNFFNVCVFAWYLRFIIKDCSSLRFRESTSITLHNGVSEHHDSWKTKMLDHGATKIIPPLPQLPVQIQCIKCIYVKHFSFFLYLYVRASTQVCTGAVVKQIHKDKHQAGALIGVP